MVSMHPCDLTKPSDCRAPVRLAIEIFDRIDVLFNNAAMAYFNGIEDITDEEWDPCSGCHQPMPEFVPGNTRMFESAVAVCVHAKAEMPCALVGTARLQPAPRAANAPAAMKDR
jgi:hypothetical protein